MLRCCLCFGAGLVSVGTRLWFFENAVSYTDIGRHINKLINVS